MTGGSGKAGGEGGRHEGAFQAIYEPVENFRRELAVANFDAFLHDLAMAYNKLGKIVGDVGGREEALEAAQEAVEKCRKSAADKSDASLHELATSLNDLGCILKEMGRNDEALQATQESVDILRILTDDNPEAYLHDMSLSFGSMGEVLRELELFTDAMSAFRNAIHALQQPFFNLPGEFLNLMENLVKDYVASANSAGREIDEPLLLPVFAKLESLKVEAERAARKGGSKKEEPE